MHAERDGRRYRYTPLLAREQYVMQESKGLLDRLFGGRVAPLVAYSLSNASCRRRTLPN